MLLITGIVLLTFIPSHLSAQDNSGKPYQVLQPTSVDKVASIASRIDKLPVVDLLEENEVKDSRYSLKSRNISVIPGKGSSGDDPLALLQQQAQQNPGTSPELVFETALSNSQPTDPAGAVGPNHYLAVTNTAFRIFDKNGNPLTGQLAPNPAIFPNGGCCDLTASYDNAADRWVITFLGNGAQIAVSDGPDPVNDTWTVYNYSSVSDYQKLSVWHDGYYMTDNTSGTFHVFERDEMLQGNPGAQMVSFTVPGWQDPGGFDSPQFLNLSHNSSITGPATMVYMADDSWASVSQDDHIKLWSVTMDWSTPTNSSVTGPDRLGVDATGIADGTVTAFNSTFDGGSFSNLTQPGGGIAIDALQWTIMNQAQFRKFPTHNSALFNFVVDTDGSAGELAGVRWYELRQNGDGQPWTIYQEGTYTAPDGRHAWNASLIMDAQGNIGMGYTSMSGPTTSSTVQVGSYFTGQLAAASGSGVMDVAEGVIMAGDANIPGLRYGDYSKIDIDPSNDKKFWFVNELMRNGRKNVCGVFQLAPNTNNDVGITSINTPSNGDLNSTESISVTVFNYGQNDASGFDVTYQIDGGAVISEPFVGVIPSATTASFTFSSTADFSTEGQTYTISACTNYSIDEDNLNDCATQDVTHLLTNDLSITQITSPTTDTSLGLETVTVSIENFGTADQSGFDVYYSLDAGALVTETVSDVVPAGGSIDYSFTQLVDISSSGQTYVIEACTALPNDQNTANDCFTTNVSNEICQPTGDCSFGDGITMLEIGTIDLNTVPCSNGYEDLTNEITDLDRAVGSNIHPVIFQTGWSPQHFSVWIDFNDNGNFTDAGELVVDTVVVPSGADGIDQTFNLSIPTDANLGTHVMRIRGFDPNNGGTLNDPCGDLQFGNTIDVSVNIIDTSLSINDFELGNSGFSIVTKPNNQFEIILTTSETEDLSFNLFNMLGQQLVYDVLSKQNGKYVYNLDMSYASSGTYIVKVGRGTNYKTGKLIVR
jgi:hypothetical protein